MTSSIGSTSAAPISSNHSKRISPPRPTHKKLSRSPPSRQILLEETSSDATLSEIESDEDSDAIIVEDVCLACKGACHCGGAEGASVKAQDRPRTNPSGKKFSSGATISRVPANSHFSIFDQVIVSGSRTRWAPSPLKIGEDLPRTAKKQKVEGANLISPLGFSLSDLPNLPALPALPAVLPALPFTLDSLPPLPELNFASKKPSSPPVVAPKPPVPTTTIPSRMSLRQVIAMSAREVSESPAPVPAATDGIVEPKRDEPKRELAPEQTRPDAREFTQRKEILSDVSDLDLFESDQEDEDEDDDEDENLAAVEKAEEAAMRKEFSAASRKRAHKQISPDLSEAEISEGGGIEWDVNVLETQRVRQGIEASDDKHSNELFDDSLDFELDDQQVAVTELPPSGGRGVVTWSDYDSVQDEDEAQDSDSNDVSFAAEFENELEQLLALSEKVVGPVRDEEFEFGQLWFEALSAAEDSGSTADDESEEMTEEEEEGEEGLDHVTQPAVATDAAQTGELAAEWDSSEGESSLASDEIYFDSDQGETTDSVESEDRVKRFGVQAQLRAGEDDDETESDWSEEFAAAENGRGKGKGKANFGLAGIPEHADEDEAINLDGPLMGVFMPKTAENKSGTMSVVVLNDAENFAPSPFGLMRFRRRKRKLSEASPSAIFSDGSTSGDRLASEIASPLFATAAMEFDLDDLLHNSILDTTDSSDETSLEEELSQGLESAAKSSPKKKKIATTPSGISDLSRWSRVPIGAFRTTTMPTRNAQPFPLLSAAVGGRGSSKPLPIIRAHTSKHSVTSLNHTLSSPVVNSNMTKRSIERRMLTSPVIGPTHRTSSHHHHSAAHQLGEDSSPKSRKLKRKEKKLNLTAGRTPKRISRSNKTNFWTDAKNRAQIKSHGGVPFAPVGGLPSEAVPALHSPLFKPTDRSLHPSSLLI